MPKKKDEIIIYGKAIFELCDIIQELREGNNQNPILIEKLTNLEIKMKNEFFLMSMGRKKRTQSNNPKKLPPQREVQHE